MLPPPGGTAANTRSGGRGSAANTERFSLIPSPYAHSTDALPDKAPPANANCKLQIRKKSVLLSKCKPPAPTGDDKRDHAALATYAQALLYAAKAALNRKATKSAALSNEALEELQYKQELIRLCCQCVFEGIRVSSAADGSTALKWKPPDWKGAFGAAFELQIPLPLDAKTPAGIASASVLTTSFST